MDDATQRRLAQLKSECGCTAGSVALLIAWAGYVSYALWLDPVSHSLGERLLVGVGVGLVAMLIGKLVGIGWARYQYRQLVRLVESGRQAALE